MGQRTLRVATRGSKLALIQVDEVRDALRAHYPDTAFEVVRLATPGDRDQRTPLSTHNLPDDFFTRDIDQALLRNEADLAVHSAKDLPQVAPDGLTVSALLPAADIRDALVLRAGLADDTQVHVIGTSSPRREAQARTLYPHAQTRPLRGSIPQRLEKLDAGEYDAIIVAACALDRLGLSGRISKHLPYDPAPQQGRLAVVTRTTDTELNQRLAAIDVRRSAGLVAMVGCPADATLLAERARLYLAHADAVFHDRLLPDNVLLAIRGKAVPVGKAGGGESTPQSEIHRLMLREAEQGRLAVRLQGGDPGIFGHLAEELQFFQDWQIRVDVVPGLTVAQVTAGRAHAALTHRGRGHGVFFLTGRPRPEFAPKRFPGPEEGNLAVYMAVHRVAELTGRMKQAGWPPDTPVTVGERVGYKDERIAQTTMAGLAGLAIQLPAVFLVGVRAFPPRGVTLFVGTDPGHFLKHGPLVHWPLIRLVARPVEERIRALQEHLPAVDGILFPGRFAVHAFMESLTHWKDARFLSGKKLLAVGPATADALARYGLRADRAAASMGGVRALAETLTPDFAGRYFYPCSDTAPREDRARLLAHYRVDLVPAVFYMNRAMPYKQLPRVPFERVIFTSTSTVRVYFENYPDECQAHRTWLAVGPSTQQALRERGLQAELLPE